MSTTSTYLAIEKNLANYQKQTAAEPAVKTATAYYKANIGKVTTAKQLVSNYRLLSYALQAYGLGNEINSTALVQQVLQQGTTSSKALANTLPNQNWKAFAKAYNFSSTATSTPGSSASVSTAVANYDEQQLESDQGQNDPGVQLALYFKRVAPTVTSGYGLLADENLLEVVQTIFKLPPTYNAAQIDNEEKQITGLVPISSLTNPTKLNQLVERFTAAYDAAYGPASGNSSSLTVTSGNTNSTATNAASSILAGVVSSNFSELNSYEPTDSIGAGLLTSLQGLALGG